MDQPNIILLTIDALRADFLGVQGRQPSPTPSIDRIASQGRRYAQAVTGGSWTQAAFPVIITSTYAGMFGGCLGPLSPQRPDPIAALKGCGYRTGAFISSPMLGRQYGYDRSFDDFFELIPTDQDPRLRGIRGGQRLLRSPFFQAVAGWFGQKLRPAKRYPTAAEINARFFDWASEAQQPFFAWIHYMDVHWPYHFEDNLESPSEIARAWWELSKMHQVNWGGDTLSPADKAHFVDLYEKAVAYTDYQVGVLDKWLARHGLDQNTILIIVSDHGEEFMERRYWGHVENNLHDEILRVPMIFRGPEVQANQVATGQVRTLDLMPTLFDYIGCQPPEGFLGRSLNAESEPDASQQPEAIAICERWREDAYMIAVRSEKHKLIWDKYDPENVLLFDLETDPMERENIAPAQPAVVHALMKIVREQQERVEQTRPAEAVEAPILDQAMLDRLRDLGYVE
jgi:arylsulfatase A-like enzyme